MEQNKRSEVKRQKLRLNTALSIDICYTGATTTALSITN